MGPPTHVTSPSVYMVIRLRPTDRTTLQPAQTRITERHLLRLWSVYILIRSHARTQEPLWPLCPMEAPLFNISCLMPFRISSHGDSLNNNAAHLKLRGNFMDIPQGVIPPTRKEQRATHAPCNIPPHIFHSI